MMDCKLIMDDEEVALGNISEGAILSLVKVLEASTIIDDEGNLWTTNSHATLYFDAPGAYFYLSLDKEGE